MELTTPGSGDLSEADSSDGFVIDEEVWQGEDLTPVTSGGCHAPMPIQTEHVYRSSANGPSQIVTYTSRFVDKLSDITDDLNISGGLSIKAGKFGGSGRGAFVDSDKFKEADLNFYVSVKVVNQSINMKDALVYNHLKSVDKDNFHGIFGDGFISGFQEGGEFNALVSMKILNPTKKSDIEAGAKVVFTTTGCDHSSDPNFKIAKANLHSNTETTIQVSWTGGGNIKPPGQQWDVQSLTQAAARFPTLVARCPQRTHAIITKYDSLRSFVELKPSGYTSMAYGSAQVYTNSMLDSYMSYKRLYTLLGSHIFEVQQGNKVIEPWPERATDSPELTQQRFPTTLSGLSQAKKEICRQMALIVEEVHAIEQGRKTASQSASSDVFIDAIAFLERIPVVTTQSKIPSLMPLNGKLICSRPQSKYESQAEAAAATGVLSLLKDADATSLSKEEHAIISAILQKRPQLGRNCQITPPMGSNTFGTAFNHLEFLQKQWSITKIQFETYNGAVSAFWIFYVNGMMLCSGEARGGTMVELADFPPTERIISASLEVGKSADGPAEPRVIGVVLYTNRGRTLKARANACSYEAERGHVRDGHVYTDVHEKTFDTPLVGGRLTGFHGRYDATGLWRLGFIWGRRTQDGCHECDLAKDQVTQAKAETLKIAAEMKELQAQLASQQQACTQEKEALKAQIEEHKSRETALSADLGSLREQIATLSSQNGSLSTQIAQLNAQVALSTQKESEWSTEKETMTAQLEQVTKNLTLGCSRALRPPPETNYSGTAGDIQIYYVAWHGVTPFTAGFQKLKQFAISKEKFMVTNANFGTGRAGNHPNGFLEVVYRYNNTGDLQYMSKPVNQETSFPPAPVQTTVQQCPQDTKLLARISELEAEKEAMASQLQQTTNNTTLTCNQYLPPPADTAFSAVAGRVQIYYAIWGNWFPSAATMQKLKTYAQTGQKFNVDGTTLGSADGHSASSSLFVAYRYNNTGPMRYLYSRHYANVSFPPIPADTDLQQCPQNTKLLARITELETENGALASKETDCMVEKTALSTQVQELTAQLNQNGGGNIPPPVESYSSTNTGKVQIYFISWGSNRANLGAGTIGTLAKLAESGQTFTVNVATLGPMSNPAGPNTLYVVYRYNNAGPVRILASWENEQQKFPGV
jgi:hypothetical protein